MPLRNSQEDTPPTYTLSVGALLAAPGFDVQVRELGRGKQRPYENLRWEGGNICILWIVRRHENIFPSP